MRALVMRGPDDYGVEEVPVPKPGFQEVLVRMRAVALCGSDPPLLEGKSRKDGLPACLPFIPGHEGAGIVAEIGPGAEMFRPGDPVAAEAHLGCGWCQNCREGRYNLCLNFGRQETGHKQYGFTVQGCYAEYCVFHIRSVHRIPEGLSCEQGALADTLATALHGIRLAGVIPGGTAAVMGCGPVGMSASLLLKAMGSRVIICGRGDRLRKAALLGADEVIEYPSCDVGKAVKALTDGLGADRVIECAGTEQSFRNSIASVKRGGTVAVIAMPAEDLCSLDLKAVVWNELTIVGSRGNPNCHEEVLRMMAAGLIDPSPMITHRFPLEQMREAVRTFHGRLDGSMKILIQF